MKLKHSQYQILHAVFAVTQKEEREQENELEEDGKRDGLLSKATFFLSEFTVLIDIFIQNYSFFLYSDTRVFNTTS